MCILKKRKTPNCVFFKKEKLHNTYLKMVKKPIHKAQALFILKNTPFEDFPAL